MDGWIDRSIDSVSRCVHEASGTVRSPANQLGTYRTRKHAAETEPRTPRELEVLLSLLQLSHAPRSTKVEIISLTVLVQRGPPTRSRDLAKLSPPRETMEMLWA